jgi:hypothetical protein
MEGVMSEHHPFALDRETAERWNQEDRLRRALENMIPVDPCHEDHHGNVTCDWCYADAAPRNWKTGALIRPMEHEADCAWMEAHIALGRQWPDGHILKGSA